MFTCLFCADEPSVTTWTETNANFHPVNFKTKYLNLTLDIHTWTTLFFKSHLNHVAQPDRVGGLCGGKRSSVNQFLHGQFYNTLQL